MAKPIIITKASGEKVPFESAKLINSLLRAGAPKEQAENILYKVNQKLFDGISTKKIYSIAFNLLKKKSIPLADRYKLKKGIMELGPEGFAFEKLVSRILEFDGYNIKVGHFIDGKCVRHEIDVIAEKNKHLILVECKYHNLPGTMCDVKVPLYINSRFLDILAAWKQKDMHAEKAIDGWIATNTKFTGDAIQYGNCVGLHLMGWNYPPKGNINQKIDQYGLYPITCLSALSKREKQFLLNKNVILCLELSKNINVLEEAGMEPERIEAVLSESVNLCRELKRNGKTVGYK